ncbi:ribosomal protein S18-alanine N-acetyltransferase [Roseinatronobacter monicus]|uniref:ribosomal protein S18-alanine N-acetyltransferase n=1 Tax=Roseinatronobacter monicus TaxID=393481 RepID=UPI003F32A88F
MTPEEMARLHAESFTLPPAWNASDFAVFLNDPGCFVLASRDNTQLAAFALFRVAADEAELLTLATAPTARRQGLARKLLQDGLARARSLGAAQCFLEVAASNDAAILLYQTSGFAQVGLRKAYYRISGRAPVDALVFRAILD